MATHPITDKVLEAQRKVLADMCSEDMPMPTQRQLAEELLWHAMFTMAALNPNVDMQRIANGMRLAITSGVTEGKKLGNHLK